MQLFHAIITKEGGIAKVRPLNPSRSPRPRTSMGAEMSSELGALGEGFTAHRTPVTLLRQTVFAPGVCLNNAQIREQQRV